ncbi:hypothetical protein U1Q18_049793 [Sarracenia purpurea var. burkii]
MCLCHISQTERQRQREVEMVREWKEVITRDTGGAGRGGGGGDSCEALWLVLVVTLAIISLLIFSCADGAPRGKDSAGDSGVYGGGCAAGCGAACGG